MSKRVGVVLSGCGFLDGTEIQEAVSVLIALDRRGAEIVCMAPAGHQASTINHLSRQAQEDGKRDMMAESARLARGRVRDIAMVQAEDLDALVFPGGFGAAKNLCTYAADGPACTVHPEVRRLLLAMHAAHKPIGLACIAPVIAARVLGEIKAEPHLTIGTDETTAGHIAAMGGRHYPTGPTDIHVDTTNRLVTTPCYMNDVGPWTVFQGAERMCEEVLRMTGDPASLIREQMATLKS